LQKRVLMAQSEPYRFRPVPLIQAWYTKTPLSSPAVLPTDAPSSEHPENNLTQREKEDRAATEYLLRFDPRFNAVMVGAIRDVIRAQFDTLRGEIAPPVEMKDVISKQFPGCPAESTRHSDDMGTILGTPGQSFTINTLERSGEHYIIETREVATADDVMHVLRLVRFYKKLHASWRCRGVLFVRMIGTPAQKTADRNAIEVYVAR